MLFLMKIKRKYDGIHRVKLENGVISGECEFNWQG